MTSYILKGYGITNENGIAKLEFDENGDPIDHSYTGVGAGEIDFVASLDNPVGSGSFVSETYSIEDCYFIETGSSTSNYSVSGGTLTLEDGLFTLTKGSGTSYFYLNIPKTALPITDFKGKAMTVKAEVETDVQLNCTTYYNNGSSWSTGVITSRSSDGTLTNNNTIGSDATQVRIRFDISGNEGDSCTLKDFRILLV